MLDSFKVCGFRTFNELSIERLGRVNLIVGRNCVGKSTLLEALWLYFAGMSPESIHEVLRNREEIVVEPEMAEGSADVTLGARSLFYGRDLAPNTPTAITLGPLGRPDLQLSLRLAWYERILTSEPSLLTYEEVDVEDVASAEGDVMPGLAISLGQGEYRRLLLFEYWRRAWRSTLGRSKELSPPFVRAAGLEPSVMGKWWDSIVLTESEERIVKFLALLVPIDRISLVESTVRSRDRVFLARLQGQQTPQPLKSLGDGVFQTLQTALAFEYAYQGVGTRVEEPASSRFKGRSQRVLLIDEVESGIHWSVLADYWTRIIEFSRQFDIQVFATTHSWDCIEGFQRAASDDRESDAMLIRLESMQGKSRAVLFDEEELAIVTRENIEVR